MIKTTTVKKAFDEKLYENPDIYLYRKRDEAEAKEGDTFNVITSIEDDVEDDAVISYSLIMHDGWGDVFEADDTILIVPSYIGLQKHLAELLKASNDVIESNIAAEDYRIIDDKDFDKFTNVVERLNKL